MAATAMADGDSGTVQLFSCAREVRQAIERNGPTEEGGNPCRQKRKRSSRKEKARRRGTGELLAWWAAPWESPGS